MQGFFFLLILASSQGMYKNSKIWQSEKPVFSHYI